MIKVKKWDKGSWGYNQSGQTSSITWAFLKKAEPVITPGEDGLPIETPSEWDYEELNPKVRCREYLGQMCVAVAAGIDYRPTGDGEFFGSKAIRDKVALSIHILPCDYDNLQSNLYILNQLEDKFGFERTILLSGSLKKKREPRSYSSTDTITTSSSEEVHVILGDKNWNYSPLLFALYTQVIRVLTYPINLDAPIVSLKDLSEWFVNTYSCSTDYRGMSSIKKYWDVDLFIDNYKEILGDSPLTGVDDKVFLEDIKGRHYVNSSIRGAYTIDNYELRGIVMEAGYFHGWSGLHSFYGSFTEFKNNIQAMKKDTTSLEYKERYNSMIKARLQCVCTSWAYRYAKLLIEKEERNAR